MRIRNRKSVLEKALGLPEPADYSSMALRQLWREYKGGRRAFQKVRLDGADLRDMDLCDVSFNGASLQSVDFSGSLLLRTSFTGANLTGASLNTTLVHGASFVDSNLTDADLYHADLLAADLTRAVCINADMRFARLQAANLTEADLDGARLTGLQIGGTVMADTDIRPLCSASRVTHGSPSYVDARSVMKSYSHPGLKQFMLSCGIPDAFAEFMIDCARSLGDPAVQTLMRSIFISYGAPDEKIARKIYNALLAHGIVTFFFPDTARIGERIGSEVFSQLQTYDRVLLICSRKSLQRRGVLNEIREVLDREAKDGAANYLLPITLDGYVLRGWRKVQPDLAERVGRRVIANFRGATRNQPIFDRALARVIDALKVATPHDAHQPTRNG